MLLSWKHVHGMKWSWLSENMAKFVENLLIFIWVCLLLYFNKNYVDKGFNKKHVGHNKNISPERDTEFFILLPLRQLSLDRDLHKGWFSLLTESESCKLSHKSTYVKIKNWSRKQSQGLQSWSQKNQNISISFWLHLQLRHLRTSKNQIVGVQSRSGRINSTNHMHIPMLFDCFTSSATACDSDSLVFIWL